MPKWLRRSLLGLVVLILLIAMIITGGFLWLRTSLPQTEGKLAVTGLGAPVTVTRDDRGVPTIKAQSSQDAYFSLGFLHAQDRLFQMDAMRRLGAGRLAEIIGPGVLATDRLMRTLGLYRSAEAQWKAASPALRSALTAYSNGVNAYLGSHGGAWPPEFYLLNYRPEQWQPADSLVWGRLMALDLSGNWQAEDTNRHLKNALPPALFDLLIATPSVRSSQNNAGGQDWRQPLSEASNSWAIGALRSTSGLPMVANDPHLGLGLPSTWYLVRMETPEMNWTGATAPGLPFIVIGTNEHVAWTFTTTHGDTQDLFEERIDATQPSYYETPDGPAPFEMRQEVFKVKGQDDVTLTIRNTRHGPVVSDLDSDGIGTGQVLALAWTALRADDRTPEAILGINQAHDATALEVALVDFHAPQQNVVYADRDGVTGFVAAGRVPLRRQIFENSRLPAPGWSGAYDWIGLLPFSAQPQYRGGPTDAIVTANNDIRPNGYQPFLTADWPNDARAAQIRTLLDKKNPTDLKDFQAMQLNHFSGPVLGFAQRWRTVAMATAPELGQILTNWDGSMARDLAAPLIATIWLDRTARALLADEMGQDFDSWWFWQADRIEQALTDGQTCDDQTTGHAETCAEIVAAALRQTRDDLSAAYGPDPDNWHWGDSHRAHFQHPVFRNVPVVADWLDADLPTDGDFFTINRGTPLPPRAGVSLSHVHGPGLRFVHDFGTSDTPFFALAGGQSGNPLSPHYADWLADWRDGRFRTILSGTEILVLTPWQSTP